MQSSSTFSVSYYRNKGVMRVSWRDSDPSIFACPNDTTNISEAILTNLTQQWDASVMNEIGLSNLLGKNTADVADALGKQLPQADEFSFSGQELVEILKAF